MGLEPAPQRKRARFHPLTVREVRRLTEDSIEVTFDVPEEFADNYDYEPGQYLALRMNLNGRELRRSYSICAVPVPGELRVAIKRDLGGEFSTWANESLTAGTVIDVMSPQGTFTTEVAPDTNRHYAAIAAGSGVTPIMSLARTILRASPNTQFSLIYSNRTANDVMFLEELADLKDRYPARFQVVHVLSRESQEVELLSGRLDGPRLARILEALMPPNQVDQWFLCGPQQLLVELRETLTGLGVPASRVHAELFHADPVPRVPVQALTGTAEGAARVTIRLDGRSSSLELRPDGVPVLEAALDVRADLPFACKGGVCGTCRARLVSGTVAMDANYALEPDEIERGYVLTCQSHPTSAEVELDFDG
ncbi:MAG: phenylacetate-CoA oxygenase/reductase subunit PaaK [Salinibacterium sp.]|nr:phenylacetate-CoA oxygenase/reductase subunit PaaK [Salinibacterium sp.]